MNKENLKKMADYIATIPKENFEMSTFLGEKNCKAVGCVIGHCIAIDEIENLKHFTNEDLDFDYDTWSYAFTNLSTNLEWAWCFSCGWESVDNTPVGASKRIMWLIEKGLPNNWLEQMCGDAPLSYINSQITNK